MKYEVHGELQPIGGGDAIPLIREQLTIGRRDSCDMNSTNGVKVNGLRVQEKLLHPRDEISIGKRKYTIQYELPADRRALDEVVEEDIMNQSLLEKAGLERPKRDRSRKSSDSFDAGDFLLSEE